MYLIEKQSVVYEVVHFFAWNTLKMLRRRISNCLFIVREMASSAKQNVIISTCRRLTCESQSPNFLLLHKWNHFKLRVTC